MRIEAGLASEGAEVETVTAAGIENDVPRACDDHLRDGVQQRLGRAAIVQSPPRCYGSRSVARALRSPLLRLEQVDVSATRDVERMSARTEQSPLSAPQRHVAIADGAEEHGSIVTAGGRSSGYRNSWWGRRPRLRRAR